MTEDAAPGAGDGPAREAARFSFLRPSSWPPWSSAAVLTAIVVLPACAAFVSVLSEQWYPTGDMAQAELHVRGFWAHPPLVGAAGRIVSDAGVQGSHPGPSLWLAMYPVYALFGRTSTALIAAALSVHTVTVLLTLRLARHLGGAALMLGGAVAFALVSRSSGPAFFLEPWNPWFAVFPFALFLLAIWATLDRSPWWLVAATVAGIHCVHCHVGYLVLVLGLGGAATAWIVVRAARQRHLATLVKPLGFGLLAAGVMWLGPVVDQLTRTPGNMSILYQHFASPDEALIERSVAAKVFGSELSVLGPWLTGPALIERNLAGAAVTLALWALAVAVAWKRRDRSALHLHAVFATALVLGALSIVRIFGSYLEYTIRWFWILTSLLLAGSLWTLWRAASATTRARLRTPALLALSGVLVLNAALATVQFTDRVEMTGIDDSRMVGALHDDVADGLQRGARYLTRWHDPVALGGVPFGLVLQLERDGYQAGVDEEFAAAALPHRVIDEGDADGLLWVVLGARIVAFRADAAFTEIAFADLRTPEERARYDELHAELTRRLPEVGRPDLVAALDEQYGGAKLVFSVPPLPADVAAAVGEFVGLRLPAAVFLAPAGTPAPPT